jgi:hypothetical protein
VEQLQIVFNERNDAAQKPNVEQCDCSCSCGRDERKHLAGCATPELDRRTA